MTFEAIINGDEINSLDPVVRIIIDNGFHHYTFSPKEVRRIDVRALAAGTRSAETRSKAQSEGCQSGGVAVTPNTREREQGSGE